MDVLAPTTMKNAAKCDTSCELQKPVSHQNFERILHFPLGSMSVGVSVHPNEVFLRKSSGRFRGLGCEHQDESTQSKSSVSEAANRRDVLVLRNLSRVERNFIPKEAE
jgi:hypothetical protein